MRVPLQQASRLDFLQAQVRRSLELLPLLPLICHLRLYPLLYARVLPIFDGDLRRTQNTPEKLECRSFIIAGQKEQLKTLQSIVGRETQYLLFLYVHACRGKITSFLPRGDGRPSGPTASAQRGP